MRKKRSAVKSFNGRIVLDDDAGIKELELADDDIDTR